MVPGMKIKYLSYFHSAFTDKVEVHVAHIQSGLTQGGNVHAFNKNLTNLPTL